MKKVSIIVMLLFGSLMLNAQNQQIHQQVPGTPVPPTPQSDFKPGGSPIGTIFFNYGYDFTEGVERSAFTLERAYLGYKYNFTEKLSARVIFDVGYDGEAFTAFAKNAFIEWGIIPHLKLTAGLIPLKHFELQEKVWGYRYIMKPHADQYGFGTTADLGVNAEIPVNDFLSFNLYFINGEGFKNIQDAFGKHKIGANATIKPADGFSLRLHYDIMQNGVTDIETGDISDTSNVSVFSAFAGYEDPEAFRFGIEYNFLNNGRNYLSPAEDYQRQGFSVFGTYIINPAFEVFARYDWITSNDMNPVVPREWSWFTDGSFILAGVQYRPVKNVNFALNYRTFLKSHSDENYWPASVPESTSGIFLNMGISW